MLPLPIDSVLPEIRRQLMLVNRLVLQAPPGAGKTTRVPLALLDEPWLQGRSILILEPRRLAARSAAARMAAELGESVGERVGYRVRFDSRIGPDTRIEVVTEGILTRRLQQDPELKGVGLVVFDEFHERHLHSDLALALCVDAQEGLRDELRILVMSATLDAQGVQGLLRAPLVDSPGRSFPVQRHYLPRDPEGALPLVVYSALKRVLPEYQGDVLVFLPGAGEIRRTAELLEQQPLGEALQVHPLYGDLPLEQQQQALVPGRGSRKVVLSTPIAETSLTIEGVSLVIDSGWARVPRFDPRSGLTRLETVRVSRAAARQRAGRAGRLGPGHCFRLWSETTQQGLIPHPTAEILEADLTPLVLELALWGVTTPASLCWLNPPPGGAVAQARDLLRLLGALDEGGRITEVGRSMAILPVHPRLAHMLLIARSHGWGHLACDVAALLAERDVFPPSSGRDVDLEQRLDALQTHRQRGAAAVRRLGADPGACRSVEQASRQWRHALRVHEADADRGVLGVLLAWAYPERVAMARGSGSDRYLLASGHGARIPQSSLLCGSAYLAVAVLDGRGEDKRVRIAATLSEEQLRRHLGERIELRRRVAWDEREQAVVAREEQCLGALVLSAHQLSAPSPEALVGGMVEGIRASGLAVLPWDKRSAQLRNRLALLADIFPDQGWPDWSDAALEAGLERWLAPYLTGMTRLAHLQRLNLYDVLLGTLSWEQNQRLQEGAPERLTVPSGATRELAYGTDGAVVLAVKLQELFGQARTPRVAWDRVPVTLHLLSPARRPIQVTQDLEGFWDRTYGEVKKELKGRYPKHPWPDDPWNAVPTAGIKRRGGS